LNEKKIQKKKISYVNIKGFEKGSLL